MKYKVKNLILVFLLTFSLVIGGNSLVNARIQTLRIEIEPLAGEIDIEDNTKEMEVNVVQQGFTDLTITDI
jgi:hypothetical protein